MKTAGIIAEYNPFHNGHKYHLAQTRALTGADYIIAVISGDYTQRGAPAVCDKYVRAKMALENGADLVLELPLFYAAGSAEYFAAGAAALLDRLGVTDFLSFGSECGDIRVLSEIAQILTEEPPEFVHALRERLKNGIPFPKARSLALSSYLSALPGSFSDALPPDWENAVQSPNNILGIEYMKALMKRKSAIRPLTIQREGAAYHDIRLSEKDGGRCSASAIRHSLETENGLLSVKGFVPDTVYELLSSSHTLFAVKSSDFSLLLHYRLLLEKENGYAQYVDISPALSDKIKKHLSRFTGYDAFCSILKSKEITFTRISRALLHILLDMKKCELAAFIAEDYIQYARILGFRRDSGALLHAIKGNASIPLISRLAGASSLLGETGNSMLKKEITASHIYSCVVSERPGVPFAGEYSRSPVIL